MNVSIVFVLIVIASTLTVVHSASLARNDKCPWDGDKKVALYKECARNKTNGVDGVSYRHVLNGVFRLRGYKDLITSTDEQLTDLEKALALETGLCADKGYDEYSPAYAVIEYNCKVNSPDLMSCLKVALSAIPACVERSNVDTKRKKRGIYSPLSEKLESFDPKTKLF